MHVSAIQIIFLARRIGIIKGFYYQRIVKGKAKNVHIEAQSCMLIYWKLIKKLKHWHRCFEY